MPLFTLMATLLQRCSDGSKAALESPLIPFSYLASRHTGHCRQHRKKNFEKVGLVPINYKSADPIDFNLRLHTPISFTIPDPPLIFLHRTKLQLDSKASHQVRKHIRLLDVMNSVYSGKDSLFVGIEIGGVAEDCSVQVVRCLCEGRESLLI